MTRTSTAFFSDQPLRFQNLDNNFNYWDATHRRHPCTTALSAAATASNTVDLAYTSYDNDDTIPAERAVVFLHGLLGNRRNFATIATALAQSLNDNDDDSSTTTKPKTIIYSLDLRNHGNQNGQQEPQLSSQWRDDMSYVAMAQDVVQFCQKHCSSQQVTLVGHSMGGKVAQAVALLYPETIHGLVVLDMAPVEYSRVQDLHWKGVCDIIDTLLQVTHGVTTDSVNGNAMTKRDLDRELRAGIPDPALRAFCLTNWDERAQQWKVNLNVIAEQLHVLAGFDLSANTDGDDEADNSCLQYAGDVLMVHGGQSRFVRSSYLPIIQSYFPNHMLTTVRGAGHWLHAEKPEDVISLLEQYMGRDD